MRIVILVCCTFMLACSKLDSNLPQEYDNLVGEWESINGDEKVTLTFKSNGEVKQKNQYTRSFKFTPQTCLYLPEDHVFHFNVNSQTLIVYASDNFDTISRIISFNQPDSSLLQMINFKKL